MGAVMTIHCKQDRDRIRQHAVRQRKDNERIANLARRLVKECQQGRAASACMIDLTKIVKG